MNPVTASGTPAGIAVGGGQVALAACLVLGACAAGTDPVQQEPSVIREIAAGGSSLTLTLDRDTLTVVDTVTLGLDLESNETDRAEFPDSTEGFGQFAVILDESAGDSLLEDGRLVRRRRYVLQPFLPGEYEIPSLTVVVNDANELSTAPVMVQVESVLQDQQDSELRDIAGPVDVPVSRWWWVAAAMAFAALLLALAWWRRRSAVRSAPRVILPHETALDALDALLADGLPGADGLKPFFLRLSDIVRRYVEDRFGLRAPEQTTEEFLAAMAAGAAIRASHQRLLRGFLEQADLVKFANAVPAREGVEGAVEAARNFVRQTVPDEPVARNDGRKPGDS